MDRSQVQNLLVILGVWLLLGRCCVAAPHDGPDPICHWVFNSRQLAGQQLKARLGPDAIFSEACQIIPDPWGEAAVFQGHRIECLVAENHTSVVEFLPKQDITVSAWVMIDQPEPWGGLAGVIQDNGNAEAGWILGYNEETFTFGLASVGSDDGNGKMTYLKGKTKYQRGKFYHVAGVYDGQTMRLYVNGQIDGLSEEQSGAILYPPAAPLVLGAYHDADEFHPLRGRIREIAIYSLAAKDPWVTSEFAHQKELAHYVPEPIAEHLDFIVRPFLQYGTETGMTVVWQTTVQSSGRVEWGATVQCENVVESAGKSSIHTVRIENLQPNTQYFYRVFSSAADGANIESEPSTFQTACGRGIPISFAVISDTQKNPQVAGAISQLAWAQRPHFLLLPGDLVDKGKKDSDWREEFFPSMNVLISRVPLFPVLGNHEENARNYFDYMALPDPEYYYSFSYGDADFFMIDSNRKVEPGSEQYRWLEEKLAASTAIWKFVCHHHPPYSSDENDYGDLWKTNASTRGDLRVRQLVPLYERYGVDIVWTGHIHSYERTWPIKEDKAVDGGGTIYMITGGGGGSLETPGPYRPFFQNHVRHGHHYVMVHINGQRLELRSYTLDDRLFDTTTIEKQAK